MKKSLLLVSLLLATIAFSANLYAEDKEQPASEDSSETLDVETLKDQDVSKDVENKYFPQPEEIGTIGADLAALTDAFVFKFKNDISLKLYGKIEMLTYYDTTSPAVSDWLAYVYQKGTYDGDHSSYSMSVRGSPVGIFFELPNAIKTAAMHAKLEVDFVGGFTSGANSTYSPLLRLKQAWASIDGKHVKFLAGQSFGIFNPLFPDTGSWIALGTSGNPWIRLPQLRLTIDYAPIIFEVSANRPMAANEAFGNQVDDIISDGEQSNMPFFMGRLGFYKTFGKDVKFSTGVSGVYGRENIHRTETNATTGVVSTLDKTLPSWLFGYDVKIITKYIDFLAEFFMGSNVNQFYAGVLQGVNVNIPAGTANAIDTIGGWGQITYKPTDKLYFNFGAGIDDPKNSDLVSGDQRTSNLTVYMNGNYKFNKWFRIGLEPCYTRTAYLNKNTNYDIRGLLRTSFIF